MRTIILMPLIFIGFIFLGLQACAQKQAVEKAAYEVGELPKVAKKPANYNTLSEEAAYVIRKQGTERAYSSALHNNKKAGTYVCAQCNLPLFHSSDKFNSGTGWPSFDDMIGDAVELREDKDGRRTEIVCSNCKGHLGHVFKNEGFTDKNTRHCVNGLSLDFVPATQTSKTEKKPMPEGVVPIDKYVEGKGYDKYAVATFAGGCFWCTEAAFERIQGVEDVISGYSGGDESYPTYKQVSAGNTSHAEAIMIYYDPKVISYDQLLQVFYVAHDGTQLNRQGPDVGEQYRSAIYFHTAEQKQAIKAFLAEWKKKSPMGKEVVTQIEPYTMFWVAEAYHQDYYELNPNQSYVVNVSRPKVQKVEKIFADWLKPKYKK